jgi:hypothetical protein
VVNDQLVAIPAYYAAQPPKELIVIKYGTHDGFSNLLEPYYPKAPWQHYTWEHYASAWFDYWLKNDESAFQKLTHTSTHPMERSVFPPYIARFTTLVRGT